MTPKTGVFENVPFSTYRQWNAVNNSLLWTLRTKSPLHAKWEHDNPQPPTPALRLGLIEHVLILEPELFAKRYIVAPEINKRTKAGKEEWNMLLAQADEQGKNVISASEYEQAQAMAKAVREQPVFNLVKGGKSEVSIVWMDEETGLLCKSRMDYVHFEVDLVIDLKTTTDAAREKFSRSIASFGYYQQAAFYSEGYEKATGRTPEWTFLPVEKSEPYAAAAYTLGSNSLEAGKISYRIALKEYARCVESGNWPGYCDAAKLVEMPDWAIKAEGVNQYNLDAA